ncbi:hypothetical protein AOLI_G00286440 [Acnodon oligacanthus]
MRRTGQPERSLFCMRFMNMQTRGVRYHRAGYHSNAFGWTCPGCILPSRINWDRLQHPTATLEDERFRW